jgi:hypothetical protein
MASKVPKKRENLRAVSRRRTHRLIITGNPRLVHARRERHEMQPLHVQHA